MTWQYLRKKGDTTDLSKGCFFSSSTTKEANEPLAGKSELLP